MSRSYRTTKESVLARRRLKRDSAGKPILPKIISRKPRAGDIHPIDRSLLLTLLQLIPEKYLYGLSKVELRAREGEIGEPFGDYRDDSSMRLYSLPLVWRMTSWSEGGLKGYAEYNARVERHDSEVIVHWPDARDLSFWFYFSVFAHELGHHFRNQYKSKRKIWGRARDEELVAETHRIRVQRLIFYNMIRGAIAKPDFNPFE